VSVAVRLLEDEFAATVKLTVPDPLPLAGETVTQLALLVAVHVQPAGVVRLTVPLLPAAATFCEVLPSVYVHAEAGCVTVNVCAAMVSVAVRLAEDEFAVAAKVTVPGPVPLDGDTVTQLALLVADQVQPASVVTPTDPPPPAAATFCDVPLRANAHVAAAWVTVNVWPAIVRVAVRVVGDGFAVVVKVTVPDPVPLAGETVTQLALLVAVQVQPAREVRLTVPLPPPAATVWADDPRLYGQDAESCETVTVCPATVTVPVRGVATALAGRVRLTVAAPLPLAGETVIQLTLLVAVHVQPASALMLTVVVPPAAPTDRVAGETPYVQFWNTN